MKTTHLFLIMISASMALVTTVLGMEGAEHAVKAPAPERPRGFLGHSGEKEAFINLGDTTEKGAARKINYLKNYIQEIAPSLKDAKTVYLNAHEGIAETYKAIAQLSGVQEVHITKPDAEAITALNQLTGKKRVVFTDLAQTHTYAQESLRKEVITALKESPHEMKIHPTTAENGKMSPGDLSKYFDLPQEVNKPTSTSASGNSPVTPPIEKQKEQQDQDQLRDISQQQQGNGTNPSGGKSGVSKKAIVGTLAVGAVGAGAYALSQNPQYNPFASSDNTDKKDKPGKQGNKKQK